MGLGHRFPYMARQKELHVPFRWPALPPEFRHVTTTEGCEAGVLQWVGANTVDASEGT